MLKQRIITALILAPSAIAAIFYLPLNYFAGLLLLITSIGAWEWGPFMGFTQPLKRALYVVSHALIIALLWYMLPIDSLWLTGLEGTAGIQANVINLLWLAVLWWVLAAFLMLSYPKSAAIWAKNTLMRAVFGYLTLVPTWLAFMVIRSHDIQITPFYGAQLLMFLFLMVWSADIGAYFVGKAMGKNKLMPNVSPGKTIEGFLGGVVSASILMSVAGIYMGWSSEQFIKVLLVTALITTVSVLGDLTESMFKRQAGVKDSGSILPGHGGILDRIDSLTATAPIFALCYVLLGW